MVEGVSDRIAVETVAARHGRDLASEETVVVPMGGAQAVRRYVTGLAGRVGVRLIGLCDRAEAGYFASASIDHHICDPDLEHELIRSLDRADLEELLAAEGDLTAFRTLQKQEPWRDRPFEAQMHRWLRAGATRNLRYARLIPLNAEVPRLPRPLVDVLD